LHLQESKRVLRDSYLFHDLNEIHLDLVLMVCEEMNFMAGERVFKQDDPGDALFIIANGKVGILLEAEAPNGKPILAAVLGPGQTFGEVVLVESGQRTATASCQTDVQLLRLPGVRLSKLCSDYPEIGFLIMRRMAAELTFKLRDANLNIREKQEGQSTAETDTMPPV